LQILILRNDFALVLALCVSFVSLASLIAWLFISSGYSAFIKKWDGVVAPFFSLPAVLFSLTAALLATSIWDNYSVATKAIKNESQGILSIISLANSVPALKELNLPGSAISYTQSIIDDEWQTLATSRSASDITDQKFVAMRAAIFKAANMLSDKAESKALLNTFYTINSARETRLAYASFDLHPVRWYAILFLGALVLIAVAFIHSSKPKALIVSITIATLTILTPLCMIGLTFSSPYQGVISISESPYLKIVK
jgi:hypothetical protein